MTLAKTKREVKYHLKEKNLRILNQKRVCESVKVNDTDSEEESYGDDGEVSCVLQRTTRPRAELAEDEEVEIEVEVEAEKVEVEHPNEDECVNDVLVVESNIYINSKNIMSGFDNVKTNNNDYNNGIRTHHPSQEYGIFHSENWFKSSSLCQKVAKYSSPLKKRTFITERNSSTDYKSNVNFDKDKDENKTINTDDMNMRNNNDNSNNNNSNNNNSNNNNTNNNNSNNNISNNNNSNNNNSNNNNSNDGADTITFTNNNYNENDDNSNLLKYNKDSNSYSNSYNNSNSNFATTSNENEEDSDLDYLDFGSEMEFDSDNDVHYDMADALINNRNNNINNSNNHKNVNNDENDNNFNDNINLEQEYKEERNITPKSTSTLKALSQENKEMHNINSNKNLNNLTSPSSTSSSVLPSFILPSNNSNPKSTSTSQENKEIRNITSNKNLNNSTSPSFPPSSVLSSLILPSNNSNPKSTSTLKPPICLSQENKEMSNTMSSKNLNNLTSPSLPPSSVLPSFLLPSNDSNPKLTSTLKSPIFPSQENKEIRNINTRQGRHISSEIDIVIQNVNSEIEIEIEIEIENTNF
eukprot:Awhi_evm1s12167